MPAGLGSRRCRRSTENRLIAIDGKTLRGSYDQRDGQAAIHMVSAWATENKLSLGQVVVDEKSNEITAIPELLRLLDVSGALVTIDAMGCQKEIAELIREGKGDYVLAVKQNQPTLYEQVEEAIDAGLEQDTEIWTSTRPSRWATAAKRRGRTRSSRRRSRSTRKGCGATSRPWGWRSRSEHRHAGTSRLEARYYILSLLLPAQRFADAVRGHWGIENNLHWQLDVSFREDECRVRSDHAPANLSVIRRFALGLLKRDRVAGKALRSSD